MLFTATSRKTQRYRRKALLKMERIMGIPLAHRAFLMIKQELLLWLRQEKKTRTIESQPTYLDADPMKLSAFLYAENMNLIIHEYI